MANSQRVSSRLAKKERTKLLRQTVFFGGIAVLIVVLFIFVILPGFVGLVDKFLSGSNPFQEEDRLPPQVPIIAPPVAATSSATLKLDGYGEPESEITLVLNGLKDESVTVSEDGTFKMEPSLQEGENTLELYATDQAGNESNSTKTYVAILDTQNPELMIEQPTDGAEVVGTVNQNYEIIGTTEPGSKVYINGRLVLPNSEGTFSYRYQLKEGGNTLELRVVDQAGNESSQELSVTLRL